MHLISGGSACFLSTHQLMHSPPRYFQALERHVRERFPIASSLAIEPRHLCGLGMSQLSASQLETLCDVHHVLLAQAEEVYYPQGGG